MRVKLNPEARAIYRGITDRIKSLLVLRESEEYLERFFPTSDRGEIVRRQEYFRTSLVKVKPELRELIARIKPIHFKRDYLHDRVLLVDESEVEIARSLNLCDVTTDPEEAKGYPLVLSTVGYGIDVELVPSQIAPELYVYPLWEGRETLEALARIGALTGEGSVAGKILPLIESFEEIARRRALIESLDELIAQREMELNRRIEEKLEKFSLTLTGKDLIRFLNELKRGQYEEIFSRFTDVEDEVVQEMIRVERELSEIIGIPVEVFSREELYPVRVSPELVERLRGEAEKELIVETYMKSREIAEIIKTYLPRLREEVRRVRELDFLQAVKSFTEGFSFPEIRGRGIAFLGGRHVFLENPQPVSYVIGEKPEWFNAPGSESVKGERIVILTGANSGGKTSLLELITQIEIMAHMGLPVPAERAWVEPLEEIFFFRRKRSTYGAGAFETALRSFVKALRGFGKKLVLIDEFEAITEPGAAVKIIGELLKVAHERNFYVVIVSHLGEELKEELPFARVDGIEAKGLDENLNLIVDRQPVFGKLGRSTPELIVERLARKARGGERELYERILSAFRG